MATSLTFFHEAIIAQLKTAFAHKVSTIRVHSPLIKTLNAPALLLALESMKYGEQRGDERTAIECDFALCGILASQGLPPEQVAIAVANFGAEIMALLHLNRWGLGEDVNNPEQISGQPAEFKPGKGGYESWAVTWQQTVYVGAISEAKSFLPSRVWVGMNTNTEADYVEL